MMGSDLPKLSIIMPEPIADLVAQDGRLIARLMRRTLHYGLVICGGRLCRVGGQKMVDLFFRVRNRKEEDRK